LGECPAGGLLEVMVVAANRAEVTLAGPPAEVVRDRMIEVAGRGGTAAAGAAAGCLADLDEVPQRPGWLVTPGFPGVGAGPCLQRLDLYCPEPTDVPRRPWPGSGAGTRSVIRPGI
jgi:hypothetical protein